MVTDDQAREAGLAEQAIFAFDATGQLSTSRILQLAKTVAEQPRQLDDRLAQMHGARRAELVAIVQLLAQEPQADEALLKDLAVVIVAAGGPPIVGQPQERLLLDHLFEAGTQTEKQLEEALGVDQIDEVAIADWAINAEARGLIERTAHSLKRPWNITNAGSRRYRCSEGTSRGLDGRGRLA